MPYYSYADLTLLVETRLAANTTQDISSADVRQTFLDFLDSFAHLEAAKDRTVTLTDDTTVDWDVLDGFIAIVTLGGNRTINDPQNVSVGMELTLMIAQDGTGSRTVTWDDFFMWPGGTPPTLSTDPDRVDIFTFIVIHDGTGYRGLNKFQSLEFHDTGWTPDLDP